MFTISNRDQRRMWLYVLVATPCAMLILHFYTNSSLRRQAKEHTILPYFEQPPVPVPEDFMAYLTGSPKYRKPPPGGLAAALGGLFTTKSAAPSVHQTKLIPGITMKAVTPTVMTSASPTKTISKSWDDIKWFFQFDLGGYPLPRFSISIDELRNYPPRNYKGPGQKAFATFFATRSGSLHDPDFLNAQQIVYRLLWDEQIKSKHPVVVFVPPFVPDEQRAYFSAAGAIVREAEMRGSPAHGADVVPSRLHDIFAKLEMWRQTDFDRIMYLDNDAFPVRNLDPIFDVAKKQRCIKARLSKQDRAYARSICDYVFAARPENFADHRLNARVMVLKPNMPMYERLIREMRGLGVQRLDEAIAEQAFLDHMFSYKSPFPSMNLTRQWNAEATDDANDPRVVHGNIRSTARLGEVLADKQWVMKNFNQTWDGLLKLYESDKFVEMRKQDLAEAMGKPAHKPKVEAPIRQMPAGDYDMDAAHVGKEYKSDDAHGSDMPKELLSI